MNVKIVSHCSACPYADDGDEEDQAAGRGLWCHLKLTTEGHATKIVLNDPKPPPGWCPLRDKPVLLVIDERPEVDR